MKKAKTIALLSAVCISAAVFTGCYEIPGALMYASAPHISEDSELITESMKIKEKYYDINYATFKPDKSVKSRASKLNDIISSGNYTLKTYYFSEGYDYDYYEWELTYPESEIDTYIDFEKSIVSGKDSWTITGCYYTDKDQNPVIDKKTCYGAYEEDIIKDGYEYYRSENNRIFYRYSPNEFGYYYDTPQSSYGKSIATGKAVIDDVEYDAEIVDYEDYTLYEDLDEEDIYDDDDIYYDDDADYKTYYLLIYDDENNLTIRIIVDQYYATASVINVDLDYADFLIYEENADNSSVIQKPKSYTKGEYPGIFY